ncbi:hypothetical protein Tco_1357503, partial [Tanacetum coccineum]
MEKAISLMGRSESVFGMSSNMMRQLPPEPSRQETFEDLVMNFILDQKERVKQLERVHRNNWKSFHATLSEENSNPQVLSSFEENTPPVTYPDEVEEIIGISIEVEPLDKTPLKDLGLNTCNHDIPLSSREIPNFDEPKPQPQPLPS